MVFRYYCIIPWPPHVLVQKNKSVPLGLTLYMGQIYSFKKYHGILFTNKRTFLRNWDILVIPGALQKNGVMKFYRIIKCNFMFLTEYFRMRNCLWWAKLLIIELLSTTVEKPLSYDRKSSVTVMCCNDKEIRCFCLPSTDFLWNLSYLSNYSHSENFLIIFSLTTVAFSHLWAERLNQ